MGNDESAPRPLVAIVFDEGAQHYLQEAIDNIDTSEMDHITIESSGDKQTDVLAVVITEATHAVVMYSGDEVSRLFPSTVSLLIDEGILTVAAGQCSDSLFARVRFRHITFDQLSTLAVNLRESPADKLRSFASASQIEARHLQEQAQNLGIVAGSSIDSAIDFEQKHSERLATRQESS